MALDHVDERAGLVVIAGAVLEPERLVVDDVHPLDVLGAPQRLEDAVGEPQTEQVEHGGPPQEVVDTVDLILGNEFRQLRVQRDRAPPIRPEGLLQGQCRALRQVDLLEGDAGAGRDGGRKREVQGRNTVARADDALQVGGRGDVGRQIPRRLQQLVDDRTVRGHGGERLLHHLAPVRIRPVLGPGAHQGEPALCVVGEQLPESGKEQPRRKVAAASENHESGHRLRHVTHSTGHTGGHVAAYRGLRPDQ